MILNFVVAASFGPTVWPHRLSLQPLWQVDSICGCRGDRLALHRRARLRLFAGGGLGGVGFLLPCRIECTVAHINQIRGLIAVYPAAVVTSLLLGHHPAPPALVVFGKLFVTSLAFR